MIFLHRIKTINGLDIAQRYGRDYQHVRKHQPSDPVSCRYVVLRGFVQLEEFRRRKSAEKFCREANPEHEPLTAVA